MKYLSKLFLLFTTCSILLATCYSHASAHVGGGPPFLKVNGVYAQTNPYYFNDPSINIPQDNTGKTYLVNQPIDFFVDTNQLLVPPDIAAASTFRWTFEEGSKESALGQQLQHTYTKPGSYILSLEVKAPEETVYTLIDTVQVDVLPNDQYKLPQVKIALATDHKQSKKPILFSSSYSLDPSANVAAIIWGFGDGMTSKEKSVLHTYTGVQDYSTFPIVFRVIDTHGFKGYAGIIVQANKNTFHFFDNLGRENTIPVSDTLDKSTVENKNKQVTFPWPMIIGTVGVVIVLLIIGIAVKKLIL